MSRLWVVGLVLAAATAYGAAGDDDFLAAREAFRVGNAAKLQTHAGRLKGHLLEPYITYWQLSLRLEQAPAEEIRAFLDANRDSPLSERLRSDWLKSLGRREQWEIFNAELPLLVSDDVEITCYALQARLRVNSSEALPEVRPLWFVARDLPDNCSPLFEALASAGMLSNEACSIDCQNSGVMPDRSKIAEMTTSLRTSPGCRTAICKAMLPPLLKPRKSACSMRRCRRRAAASSADCSKLNGRSSTSAVRPCPCCSKAITCRVRASGGSSRANEVWMVEPPPWSSTSGRPLPWIS